MNATEEETACGEAQRRLSTDVQLNTCNGVTLLHPDTIGIDYINLWFSFTMLDTDQKRLHDNLICSWNKRKIAMIDNGYDIDIDNIDEMRKDPELIIKYIMTTQCDIRTLPFNVDDNPTTIYYDRSLWKEAVLLYLFHINKGAFKDLPDTITFKHNNDFDIFQGILLGYSADSIYEYCIANEIADIILENIKKYVEGIKVRSLFSITYDKRMEIYSSLKPLQKRDIYTKCYFQTATKEKDLFMASYKNIQKYINHKLEEIDQYPELRIMALGVEKNMYGGKGKCKSRKGKCKSRKGTCKSRKALKTHKK
jgi:hypothetical protein